MTNDWKYSRAPADANAEMAVRMATRESKRVGHFHDQVQIVAVLMGWRAFVTPAGTLWANAGQIAVLPAGVFHAPLMCARSVVTNLYLDQEHPAARYMRRPAILDGQGAAEPEDILDRVAAVSIRLGSARLRAAELHLIDRVVGTEVPIKAIAEGSGYSVDGFTRLFSRHVGTTPAKYRIAHRLNLARSLLKQGATPAGATYASGFADQSHLGRCFLRAYGTTPAAYRAGMCAA